MRLPANGSGRRSGSRPYPFLREASVIEGSVLLVEDEEAVLEFERDVLAGAGAKVVNPDERRRSEGPAAAKNRSTP